MLLMILNWLRYRNVFFCFKERHFQKMKKFKHKPKSDESIQIIAKATIEVNCEKVKIFGKK